MYQSFNYKNKVEELFNKLLFECIILASLIKIMQIFEDFKKYLTLILDAKPS